MQFKGISLLIVITVIVGGSLVVSAQQNMQNMPGMKMGNKGQKKKTTTVLQNKVCRDVCKGR